MCNELGNSIVGELLNLYMYEDDIIAHTYPVLLASIMQQAKGI